MCDNWFASPQSLWNHKNRCHNPDNYSEKGKRGRPKKTTICCYCDKDFSTTSNLTRHKITCKKNPNNFKETTVNNSNIIEKMIEEHNKQTTKLINIIKNTQQISNDNVSGNKIVSDKIEINIKNNQ